MNNNRSRNVAVEIERKFLLRGDAWRAQAQRSLRMVQAYLGGERCSIRVRIEGEEAFLNLKSRDLGTRRLEFEYPVPLEEAEHMLAAFGGQQVAKTRHFVERGGHTWEIDEFSGDNAGLVVAEIELAAEDEAFERPDWIGAEVTMDPRYYNVNLARTPFRDWADRATLASGA
jgi:adenylate cyclase